MNNPKPQIPADDVRILDSLVSMLRTGSEKEKQSADAGLTIILQRYNELGFDTMKYAAELMLYAATKRQIVLREY